MKSGVFLRDEPDFLFPPPLGLGGEFCLVWEGWFLLVLLGVPMIISCGC